MRTHRDLSVECFQIYVAQDAYFLESFARAYALALAKSPDREGVVCGNSAD